MSKEILKYRLQTLIKLIDHHDLSTEREHYLLEAIEKLQNYIKYADLLEQDDQDVKLLIPKKKRRKGLNFIRDFTKDAKELIIIDPYFFAGYINKINNYTNEVKKSIGFQNLDRLIIIYDESKSVIESYKNAVKELAKSHDCNLALKTSYSIHDRIWIKDRSKIFLVGTSFGSIGENKLSFITELSNEDLEDLLKYLSDNSLL